MKIYRLYQRLESAGGSSVVTPAISPPPMFTTPGVSPGTLRGLATTYNNLSCDLGGYRLRILPGAFSQSLKSGLVLACWAHIETEIFASTKNKTLRLYDSDKGLGCEIDVAPTGRGMDTFALVSGDYVREMSIGFLVQTVKFRTEKMKDGSTLSVEEISKGKIFEISCVARGAMPGTSIAAITTTSPGVSRNSAPQTDAARLKRSINGLQEFTGKSDRASAIARADKLAAQLKSLIN